MSQRLKDEIRQTRPFLNLEEEVFLEIRRTAEMLVREVTEALRPTGLTGTQYNVLRILRGAGEQGITCGQVGERMVTHDPDLTRLMDRLEKRGLIQRSRDERDRRVVLTRITAEGTRLMKELDGTVAAAHKQALGHLGEKKLRALGELLGAARTRE
jgi:DNA-binding MarR family transcriptional regulator